MSAYAYILQVNEEFVCNLYAYEVRLQKELGRMSVCALCPQVHHKKHSKGANLEKYGEYIHLSRLF